MLYVPSWMKLSQIHRSTNQISCFNMANHDFDKEFSLQNRIVNKTKLSTLIEFISKKNRHYSYIDVDIDKVTATFKTLWLLVDFQHPFFEWVRLCLLDSF